MRRSEDDHTTPSSNGEHARFSRASIPPPWIPLPDIAAYLLSHFRDWAAELAPGDISYAIIMELRRPRGALAHRVAGLRPGWNGQLPAGLADRDLHHAGRVVPPEHVVIVVTDWTRVDWTDGTVPGWPVRTGEPQRHTIEVEWQQLEDWFPFSAVVLAAQRQLRLRARTSVSSDNSGVAGEPAVRDKSGTKALRENMRIASEELARRSREGLTARSASAEASYVAKWFKLNHPAFRAPAPKTIQNYIYAARRLPEAVAQSCPKLPAGKYGQDRAKRVRGRKDIPKRNQ